jgi:hypothetical protein
MKNLVLIFASVLVLFTSSCKKEDLKCSRCEQEQQNNNNNGGNTNNWDNIDVTYSHYGIVRNNTQSPVGNEMYEISVEYTGSKKPICAVNTNGTGWEVLNPDTTAAGEVLGYTDTYATTNAISSNFHGGWATYKALVVVVDPSTYYENSNGRKVYHIIGAYTPNVFK